MKETDEKLSTRRELLQQMARIGACLPLTVFGLLPLAQALQDGSGSREPRAAGGVLSQSDDEFLEEVERTTFNYFWEQSNPATGIVRDRFSVRSPNPAPSDLGSIAATGFGLTALCIADKRGWVPSSEARARVLDALRFLSTKMPSHRGFFYHWANVNTGERLWDAEVSSVDTAILLCGILTCRRHFRNTQISQLARRIFNRADWKWLSEDTAILPHGWRPETGFLQYRWNDYSEMMMIYLLGIGSYTHPLPAESWNAWKRLTFEYEGIRYIGSFAPLFVHQYSQAWFDFRGKRDRHADYFHNSVIATDVHRRFCLQLAKKFPSYSDDLWGITASDSPKGYTVWGGPPARGPLDGTVVPSAAGGSLPFLPQACIRVLRHIKDKYPDAWSRYGYVDAFNPLTNWYATDVIGIDAGITLVMAENLRTGLVWNTFMKNPEARRGMDRAGFKPYTPPY